MFLFFVFIFVLYAQWSFFFHAGLLLHGIFLFIFFLSFGIWQNNSLNLFSLSFLILSSLLLFSISSLQWFLSNVQCFILHANFLFSLLSSFVCFTFITFFSEVLFFIFIIYVFGLILVMLQFSLFYYFIIFFILSSFGLHFWRNFLYFILFCLHIKRNFI